VLVVVNNEESTMSPTELSQEVLSDVWRAEKSKSIRNCGGNTHG